MSDPDLTPEQRERLDQVARDIAAAYGKTEEEAVEVLRQAFASIERAARRSRDPDERVKALEIENRWLRSIIFEHVGTDPENIGEGRPPTPEEEAEEADFQRRVDERRRRMFGDDSAGRG